MFIPDETEIIYKPATRSLEPECRPWRLRNLLLLWCAIVLTLALLLFAALRWQQGEFHRERLKELEKEYLAKD